MKFRMDETVKILKADPGINKASASFKTMMKTLQQEGQVDLGGVRELFCSD